MLDTRKTSVDNQLSERTSLLNLEPHVELFYVDEKGQSKFTLPYQLMLGALAVMLVLAFYFWFSFADTASVQIVTFMQIIFAPIYVPGIYLYTQYYRKDRKTKLEIDSKNMLIQYESGKERLLFHTDQVYHWEVKLSKFLPYQLHYCSLYLEGGKVLHISNLVIDPEQMGQFMQRRPRVEQQFFNPLP